MKMKESRPNQPIKSQSNEPKLIRSTVDEDNIITNGCLLVFSFVLLCFYGGFHDALYSSIESLEPHKSFEKWLFVDTLKPKKNQRFVFLTAVFGFCFGFFAAVDNNNFICERHDSNYRSIDRVVINVHS